MTKFTALVITFNEIIHVEDLIKNLSFADEIIVVDGFSTDGTFEKLKSYKNVTVFQYKFKNFADQKNYALSLASHDWILFLDADERISDAYKKDILEKINSSSDIVAYTSLFRYYFGNTPIKYSGFQTAKSYRLFKKSTCTYDTSVNVHEKLLVNGKSGMLKHRVTHYSFRDYAHYKEKMRLYAHIKANALHIKGKKTSLFKKTIKPIYRFFNHYIMRLGILDGKIGYYISILNAYEVTERYRELDRLNTLSLSK